MEYRTLGRSGLQISELGLGTLSFGRQCDEALSHRLIDLFVHAGGNFFDSSNSYNAGRSEEILGNWLQRRSRADYVVATKVRFPTEGNPTGGGPNRAGLSRKHILHALEETLHRLKTDYVDLYQIHCWDFATDLEETLRTLDSLVQSGKVRYIGASNLLASQLQRSLDTSRFRGWVRFVSLQPQYSLLERSIEWEILPLCLAEGVGVLPWSPLRHGWLTGKYRHDSQSPAGDSRLQNVVDQGWTEAWAMREEERTWRVVDALVSVAEQVEKSPAQVALNWLLRQSGVTSPIIGVRNEEQLQDNLGACGWKLEQAHVGHLTEVSETPLPYPHDFLARYCGA